MPTYSFAYEKEFVITDILSDQVIKIQRLDKEIIVASGDLLIIYSHETKDVLGYARVEVLFENDDIYTATIRTHNKSGIIRTQNYLKRIDLTQLRNNVPARYDLSYNDDRKVAGRYRPLVYTGLSQGFTASNLKKNETLLGPSILSYGLTNRHQVNTNLISTMFKIVNVSFKTMMFSNDEFDVSVENGFQYYHEKTKGSYQLTGYLDSSSNSNFKSHFKLRLFTKKPEDEYLYNNEEYKRDFNVELQLSYGYLLSNWDRIIFGPKIDVNKKRVGGVIGYYIIDRHFNTMIGVSSNDFSEFKIGKQGYLLNLDFWWRF